MNPNKGLQDWPMGGKNIYGMMSSNFNTKVFGQASMRTSTMHKLKLGQTRCYLKFLLLEKLQTASGGHGYGSARLELPGSTWPN